MSIIPKAIHRFNAIPIKIPMTYFTELEQIFQKFILHHKRAHIATTILRKKQSWRNHPTYYQTILQGHSNQHSMVLAYKQSQRSVEQKREPRNKPHLCSQLKFDQGSKQIQWAKDSLFNKQCLEN